MYVVEAYEDNFDSSMYVYIDKVYVVLMQGCSSE